MWFILIASLITPLSFYVFRRCNVTDTIYYEGKINQCLVDVRLDPRHSHQLLFFRLLFGIFLFLFEFSILTHPEDSKQKISIMIHSELELRTKPKYSSTTNIKYHPVLIRFIQKRANLFTYLTLDQQCRLWERPQLRNILNSKQPSTEWVMIKHPKNATALIDHNHTNMS